LDPFANAFFYAAANLPGNLLSAFLMDKVGGKGILFGSLMMASVCAGLFAYVSSGNASAFVIITLACSFNAFSTSGWNAIDLMSAESFPTDVRTTGMGFLSAGGRIGSVFAQLVNGYLIGPPAHVELLLSITAIMMLLGGVSCFFVRDQSGKVLLRSVSQLRNQTNYSSYSEDEGEDDLKNSTTLNLPHR
jgi:MFS family permease